MFSTKNRQCFQKCLRTGDRRIKAPDVVVFLNLITFKCATNIYNRSSSHSCPLSSSSAGYRESAELNAVNLAVALKLSLLHLLNAHTLLKAAHFSLPNSSFADSECVHSKFWTVGFVDEANRSRRRQMIKEMEKFTGLPGCVRVLYELNFCVINRGCCMVLCIAARKCLCH